MPELPLVNFNTCVNEPNTGTYLSAGEHLWSIYTVQSTLRLVPPQLHCGLAGPKQILIHAQVLQSHLQPWWSCGARGGDRVPLFGSSSRSWAPATDGKHIPRAQDLLLCTDRVTGTSFEQTPVRTVNLNCQALKHSIWHELLIVMTVGFRQPNKLRGLKASILVPGHQLF